MSKIKVLIAALALVSSASVDASLCGAIGLGEATVGATSVVGSAALTAGGYWIVPNATTGALMLAGPSSGIIAGTATGIGAVAAALMSPVAIIAGGAVLAAGGATYATCYLLNHKEK